MRALLYKSPSQTGFIEFDAKTVIGMSGRNGLKKQIENKNSIVHEED
jgi:hypothetical protein